MYQFAAGAAVAVGVLSKVVVVGQEPVVPHRMKGNICPLGIFLLRSFDNTFCARARILTIICARCSLFGSNTS